MNYKITEMYAYIADGDEGEGIIGQTVNMGGHNVFMPFVCADKARVESLRQMAVDIGLRGNKTIKLIKFTNRKDLEVFECNQQ